MTGHVIQCIDPFLMLKSGIVVARECHNTPDSGYAGGYATMDEETAMPDTLETLLLQLAGMRERAQAMVAAEYQPDAVFDWGGDHKIWIGMEQSDDGGWGCGWLMRVWEVAEFVIEANGRTPVEAALALREKMIKGE